MIQEALKYLFEQGRATAKAAATPTITKVDAMRFALTMNGESTLQEVETPPVTRYCQHIDSLIRVAESEGENPRYWVNTMGVTAEYTNDRLRRSQAWFELATTAEWQSVFLLQGTPSLSQRDAVRLFFHHLRGCVDPKTHNLFRKLDWSVDTKTRATVQRSQESLGREVLSQVNAADAIPEELEIVLPVWTNFSCERQRIMVTIDIDHAAQKFVIQPLPNALEMAQQKALVDVYMYVCDALDDVAGDRVLMGVRS